VEAISLAFKTFSLPYKRIASISALSLRTPIRSPALIDLDLPLPTLTGIARKRQKLLTCRQDTTRAKLE
jgi:hypothetical protein